MVNDNRRAEQRGGVGWEGTQGREHGELNTGLPLLAAISQTRKTFTTWFMALSGEWMWMVECVWWLGERGGRWAKFSWKISRMKSLKGTYTSLQIMYSSHYCWPSSTAASFQIDILPSRQPLVSFHCGIIINFRRFEMGNLRFHCRICTISMWRCSCKLGLL